MLDPGSSVHQDAVEPSKERNFGINQPGVRICPEAAWEARVADTVENSALAPWGLCISRAVTFLDCVRCDVSLHS